MTTVMTASTLVGQAEPHWIVLAIRMLVLWKIELLDSCIENDYGFALVNGDKWCCVCILTNCS